MIQQDNVVQEKPKTTILFYNVFGHKCPIGKNSKICGLRKELQDWQAKYSIGDGFDGFCYRVMENGNLLVPVWYRESETEKGFSIKLSIEKQCYGDCFWFALHRETENLDDFNKQPQMQTIVYGYETRHEICPDEIAVEKCPLRKELADLEEKYEIGYRVLEADVLLAPGSYYNRKNNLWFDIDKRAKQICWKCFLKQNGKNK